MTENEILNQTKEGLCSIRDELRGIRQVLERMEKALPGCNQEAHRGLIRDEVNQMFQSLASSAHTPVKYK